MVPSCSEPSQPPHYGAHYRRPEYKATHFEFTYITLQDAGYAVRCHRRQSPPHLSVGKATTHLTSRSSSATKQPCSSGVMMQGESRNASFRSSTNSATMRDSASVRQRHLRRDAPSFQPTRSLSTTTATSSHLNMTLPRQARVSTQVRQLSYPSWTSRSGPLTSTTSCMACRYA